MYKNTELFKLYLADMKEYLELLNESLLQLDKAADNKDIINTIFRCFHSMKGSTASMGFSRTAELIHRMEDLLQALRENRMKADSKITQLLFDCHDFLERFTTTISTDECTDSIDCPDIMEQLDAYLKKQDIYAHSSKAGTKKAGEYYSECILSPAELDYVKRKASAGFKPYVVSMKIADSCPFKALRTWMAFEMLEQYAEIIKSCPVKPSREDFTDDSFVLDSTDIKALVISTNNETGIKNHLNASLTEVEQITVYEYDFMQEITQNTINNIIENNINVNDISCMELHETVIKEIRNHVCQSEIFCLDAISDSEETMPVKKIQRTLHAIKSLSMHINHTIIYSIAADTEKQLDNCLKKKANLDGNQLDALVRSLSFIKELCDNPVLSSNQDFLREVDKHLIMPASTTDGKTTQSLPGNTEPCPEGLKLGEILIKKGVMNEENVNYLIDKQRNSYSGLKFGQIALKEGRANLRDVVDALNVQRERSAEQKSVSFIRVPEQKVDSLVDMLGELLIVQSLHKKETSDLLTEANKTDNRVLNNIIRMEKITKDIQNISMSLRMVSLKQSFQKLLRIGRDTAVDLQKDVNIAIFGEETEIDRSVVEKIQDPLMHLVRNALSHGIETRQERAANGKPAQGQLEISAYNRRGLVYIEITDDGKGLSVEKIYKKAKEKNLIDPCRSYTDDEIIKFIYLPGFSTQENINNVSGRGVGMNVVETEIVKIGGKIEITNHPGFGCTFTLKIPINLATINGTIVDLFGERYILPTLNIKQLIKPEDDQWVSIKGKPEMIKIRNEIIQVIPIDRILGKDYSRIDYRAGMIIVIEQEHVLRAIPVNNVLGKQEIVVKPLGQEFHSLDFVSGATILGDGRVSLILDVESLFRHDIH